MVRRYLCLIMAASMCLVLLSGGCAKSWDNTTRLNVALVSVNGSGLEILVTPRDSRGRLMPLAGNLDVKLWVYENSRGCGLCEGEYRQEWPDIQLTEASYQRGQGARLSLPFEGFYPDTSEVGALELTLAQDGYTISGKVDGLNIGTDSFS